MRIFLWCGVLVLFGGCSSSPSQVAVDANRVFANVATPDSIWVMPAEPSELPGAGLAAGDATVWHTDELVWTDSYYFQRTIRYAEATGPQPQVPYRPISNPSISSGPVYTPTYTMPTIFLYNPYSFH